MATLEESHSHTPVREICSEGVNPSDDLRDFWWMSCRMARLQYGAKILGPVPNILFVFYSVRIVRRIVYSYSAE